ncbi:MULTISPECIES: iron-containing alcohol dehydrogenase family protein [Prochlorococcus]|uniref:Glycerol dehydrogenase family enzyme n=1 Tax=Prochlorococcus marinus (strain SARG / CCMP1375 / SS120) TaxID=167539 RepID=Q7VBI4_PROMA|nr:MULTISPECIES: iron-containing alcohol dehydrogenase family protein [Prochlorococcus]AAQ00153.1 Glycerol dehydrogenase family enzyme [Prochlorococcus marinus subsp. marinus str. CCMP1375]KGG13949.1 Glycerol dehydrogenase [Prochlorococcus marinus str. LG]KGG19082.1 Glycerol dehydrogenase [Prochlorococcus marinus str. SS2]KGG23378.1 Glycerol dehydrogenase [Prochlorococcus marinus str. SS35]KGG32386.1 Glycerol dehydrogenase [Prochlorococcus marinus str. SS51]
MQNTNFLQNISPERVIRGESAWEEGKSLIQSICKKPLFLGRSHSTSKLRSMLEKDLINIGINIVHAELEYDCCDVDLNRIYQLCKDCSCDGIIASGGGKVLDAGKLIANNLNLPCITVPLSASTCAGWTALANIYSKKGAFIKDQTLNNCPKLLIFDYSLVRKAPNRLLASGIADALAKWYEASLSNAGSNDALVQQAVQMARVLRDQLLIDGFNALQNPYSSSWIRVAESCSLTAGLIGGVGGAKCRTAAAHAVHNGLTQLDFTQKALHGELVGFGILVQLRIEEKLLGNQLALQAKNQLITLLKELNLPTNLKSLGINLTTKKELEMACIFSCRDDSDIHNLPFKVDKETLMEAILETDRIEIEKISPRGTIFNC